jgi:hypothetical protein
MVIFGRMVVRYFLPYVIKNVPIYGTSEDILGEIILYKPLRENIFVYFIMSALYFNINIF